MFLDLFILKNHNISWEHVNQFKINIMNLKNVHYNKCFQVEK
jgi:hypothetical protein